MILHKRNYLLTSRRGIISIVEQIKAADNVAIFATADLESIVSLAFLESAMMDANIPYSRKILHSTKFQPKGEAYNFLQLHQPQSVLSSMKRLGQWRKSMI